MRSAIFTQTQEREKGGFIYAWAENYLQRNKSETQLDNIAHEQTIICRQLFAGHVLVIEKEEKLFATNDMFYYLS